MAFRVISSPDIANRTQSGQPKPIEQAPVMNEPTTQSGMSSEGPGLLGRLGFALSRGFEAPGQFVDKLNQLLGEPSFMVAPPFSEQLREGFGYQPEQLQPQSALESYAQKVAQQAPTAALFGPTQVARSAASAIPASLAGQLGASEGVQDLVQLGSELIGGKLAGKLPGIKDFQKKYYDAARSFVPEGAVFDANPIAEGIIKTGDSLKTEANEKVVRTVDRFVNTLQNNMRKFFERPGVISDKINPSQLMDIRKSINKTINTNIRRSPEIYEHAKPLLEGIEEFFVNYGAENPQFFNSLKAADKLTAAKNMQSYIEKFIEKLPLGMGQFASIPKGILKSVFGSTIGSAEKFLRRVIGNDQARDVYLKMVKSAVEDNPDSVLRNLKNLQDIVAPEKKESTQSRRSEKRPQSSGRFKIISQP